ncbi:MAG: hypothetical protein R2729_15910 [Bryobacteraceae bacterium]
MSRSSRRKRAAAGGSNQWLGGLLGNPTSQTTVAATPARRRVFGELTLNQLQSIPSEATKPQIISQLGSPAATVLIPEAGGLREVLYYTREGDMAAAVSVNPDGAVTHVTRNVAP